MIAYVVFAILDCDNWLYISKRLLQTLGTNCQNIAQRDIATNSVEHDDGSNRHYEYDCCRQYRQLQGRYVV